MTQKAFAYIGPSVVLNVLFYINGAHKQGYQKGGRHG